MEKLIFLLGILGLLLTACKPDKSPPATSAALTLSSPAFAAGASIPVRYTCKGQDVSPALEWSEPPAGTQSFVLIMDDPDAPVGTWVHWVVYYIPAEVRSLEQGVANGKRFDDVALLFGRNSWGRAAYGGPCPPSGTHRYFFKLYALDNAPAFPENADKKAVEAAMDGHVLGYGELMGTFSK